MGLVDALMEHWARAERLRGSCEWCRGPMPEGGSSLSRLGRACSEACAEDLADRERY